MARRPMKAKPQKEFEIGDWVWRLKYSNLGVQRPSGAAVQIINKEIDRFSCRLYQLSSDVEKQSWIMGKYLVKARGKNYG